MLSWAPYAALDATNHDRCPHVAPSLCNMTSYHRIATLISPPPPLLYLHHSGFLTSLCLPSPWFPNHSPFQPIHSAIEPDANWVSFSQCASQRVCACLYILECRPPTWFYARRSDAQPIRDLAMQATFALFWSSPLPDFTLFPTLLSFWFVKINGGLMINCFLLFSFFRLTVLTTVRFPISFSMV